MEGGQCVLCHTALCALCYTALRLVRCSATCRTLHCGTAVRLSALCKLCCTALCCAPHYAVRAVV